MGLLGTLENFEDHNKELRVLNSELKVQVRDLKAVMTTLKETPFPLVTKPRFLIIKCKV